jgi:hypothetical protein
VPSNQISKLIDRCLAGVKNLRHQTAGEDGNPVAALQQLIEVGGNEYDPSPLLAPFLEKLPHPNGRSHVKPARGVLQEQRSEWASQ